jgi:hypothetical protein
MPNLLCPMNVIEEICSLLSDYDLTVQPQYGSEHCSWSGAETDVTVIDLNEGDLMSGIEVTFYRNGYGNPSVKINVFGTVCDQRYSDIGLAGIPGYDLPDAWHSEEKDGYVSGIASKLKRFAECARTGTEFKD